eukprot:2904193-Prymnesium_polylepis.2
MAGGFYGYGVYLAEDAAYPVGGRYAHRVSGTAGQRVELLCVRAALGCQQDLGSTIDETTRALRMPGIRSEGPPVVRFDSVRGGPHRPFASGQGDDGLDATHVHVVYDSRQLLPEYLIEIELVRLDAMATLSMAAPPMAAPSSVASGAGGSSSACGVARAAAIASVSPPSPSTPPRRGTLSLPQSPLRRHSTPLHLQSSPREATPTVPHGAPPLPPPLPPPLAAPPTPSVPSALAPGGTMGAARVAALLRDAPDAEASALLALRALCELTFGYDAAESASRRLDA